MRKILILGPTVMAHALMRALIQIGASPSLHSLLAEPARSYPEKIDTELLTTYREPKIHTYPIVRRGARNNHQAMRAQVVRHTQKPRCKKSMRNH